VLVVLGQLDVKGGAAVGADQLVVQQVILVHGADRAAVGAGHLVGGLLVVILVIVGVKDQVDQVGQILVQLVHILVHLVQGVVVLGDGGGHLLQQIHHRGDDL